jgi:DNA-directed RNA polymerase specialized sigma24 family protein
MTAPLRLVTSLPEEAAFELLLGGVLGRSHRFALELVGDAETAARLIQEGAMTAFRTVRRGGLPVDFPLWFLRILSDVFLARFASATPARPMGDTAEVIGAFQAMPPRDRLVNALYFAADLTYDDMARLLGLPVAVVRARLHRGRRVLLRLVGA